MEKWLEPYEEEIKNYYGDHLSEKDVKAVILNILERYCNAEHFDPEFEIDL